MGRDRKLREQVMLKAPRHGYAILLSSLLILWMLSPFLEMVHLERVGSTFLITMTLFAASYAMSDQGKSFIAIIALGLVFAVGAWIAVGMEPPSWAVPASLAAGLLFFGVVAYELLVDILSKEARVDTNLICGAVSVYLMIGVCFSFVFELIFNVDPDAFRGISPDGIGRNAFMYYSFVTLTTLGYGDISPITKIGGSFATLEAIIGQLYLTVLVARLVGMHISQGPKAE